MNFEEKLEELEICSKQIKYYEPDPFYVDHFFKEFMSVVVKTYQGIFEEASRDFGLFGNISSKEEFRSKAEQKNDNKALEFVAWFNRNFEEIHSPIIPGFIKDMLFLIKKNHKLPQSKIMITPKIRYPDDEVQGISVVLSGGKLKSKLELTMEFQRQLPSFLQIINRKRIENSEPTVSKKEIVLRSFIENKNEKIEIVYATAVYWDLLNRFLGESNKKVKELTSLK